MRSLHVHVDSKTASRVESAWIGRRKRRYSTADHSCHTILAALLGATLSGAFQRESCYKTHTIRRFITSCQPWFGPELSRDYHVLANIAPRHYHVTSACSMPLSGWGTSIAAALQATCVLRWRGIRTACLSHVSPLYHIAHPQPPTCFIVAVGSYR